MRTFNRLRALFRSVTGLTIAASAASGCGGVDHGAFAETVCDGLTYKPLAGVTPSIAVDYMELRVEAAGQTTPNVSAQEGVPCKGASDGAKCLATLDSIRSDTGWELSAMFGNAHAYLVYTRGDEVAAVTSLDALAAFVDVNNAKDAALLATRRDDHHIVCSEGNNARKTSSGYEIVTGSGSNCGEGAHVDENVVSISKTGAFKIVETHILETGDPSCIAGRRPQGLSRNEPVTGNDVGRYFAEVAHLEAAAVFAFQHLARELEAHGAPASLIGRARWAARDEVRHARLTTALALRFGTSPRAPVVGDLPIRTLVEIALENAVEGCVRETFGAQVATYQAERALDPEIAKTMRAIAKDETRHAALAWDVAAWLESELSPAERGEVAEARGAAVEALRSELRAEPETSVQALAGVPAATDAGRMVDALGSLLWAA